MIPVVTQKILELLAQVIVADGHIYESELEAFAASAKDIPLLNNKGERISEDFVRGWFEAHAGQISAFRSNDNSDVDLTRLILSLAEYPEKQAVVDALIKISKSDGNEHLEEKLLISIVKSYWQHDGLDAPGSKIGA